MSKVIQYSLLATLVFGMHLPAWSAEETEKESRPNIIVIFADDMGYGDLACFGAPTTSTPRLDRMAEEGIRLTDFYVGASVCSASRACLLTGRIALRHKIGGAFFPGDGSMSPKEITIAEVLKDAGYRTACFGKWHLGDDRDEVLPIGQGFDEYYGIPYSNDMYIHPDHVIADGAVFTDGYDFEKTKMDQAKARELMDAKKPHKAFVEAKLIDKVPLFEGNECVEYPADQATLTKRYIDRAIQFVDESKDEPFFIYITPAMPHTPLFASEQFLGKSKRGLYGDCVEEIDWNVGRLLDYLEENGHGKDTMVIFTSDNGPWLGKGKKSGSSGEFRGGKHYTFEGGCRVPCIMWWPGKWPAGTVSAEPLTTLDFMPTFAHYAATPVPDVKLDGVNIAAFLEEPSASVDRDYLVYTKHQFMSGLRKGDWKYLRHGGSMHQTKKSDPELYNLKDDIGEQTNLMQSHPEVASALEEELVRFEQSLKK